MPLRRPTPEDLRAATGRTVPDVIAQDLAILFCGINPGLYSAATGHHFARPGNRFWPALHQSGITPRQLSPAEERELLPLGVGITNIVPRSTAMASELTPEELRAGGRRLTNKVKKYRPRCLAILGISAYRFAFGRPKAQLGRQPETIGPTLLWVLPNPSGLNAHYQLPDLAKQFRALREAVNELA
jgi:TDG/mug DNA glycosylase family protein